MTISGNNHQLLQDALARNAAVVLTVVHECLTSHHKSRFLAEAAGGAGIWVESAGIAPAVADQLIAARTGVALSFKSTTHRAVCHSAILRRDAEFRLNAETTVPAF